MLKAVLFLTQRGEHSPAEWSRQSRDSRALTWLLRGADPSRGTGLLGIGFPEGVGGSGGDITDTVAVVEEMIQAGASSGLVAALFTHGIAVPHIVASGNQDLIDRYVRPTLAGETIGALAITEPEGGSDVAAIRTKAPLRFRMSRVCCSCDYLKSCTAGIASIHSCAAGLGSMPFVV